MSECPTCGQEVLIEDGTITDHLNPDTLQPCKAKAPTPANKKAPAKKAAAATKKATPKSK